MARPSANGLAAFAGWSEDDHAAALAAYLLTADRLGPEWPLPSAEPASARDFFEGRFEALGPARAALLTGYYEPELAGSRRRHAEFRHPLYAPPAALEGAMPWSPRSEIEEHGLLDGLELVWLASPLEAFLAQVQGSVRVRLAEGGTLRLGYAAKNGHPYRSIGAELVRRGAVPAESISAAAIRAWAAAHPDEVPALLRHNPSFVFFRTLDLAEGLGPPGALGRSLTALRSLAVDPAHIALGSPVWVVWSGGARLMIAQDIGGAITGPDRADLFFGTGAAAGESAGSLHETGRILPLGPRAGRFG
ncbi:MAG: MltA domain-containing protein [Defluviimonas sp.]|uniref:MltA domain-containing protein n=1 Tax=Albidovulum sp. TaxID=1872424 RepID=UPI002A27B71E|nr:MltA domain-containing protein [Defluviimonas sp.]